MRVDSNDIRNSEKQKRSNSYPLYKIILDFSKNTFFHLQQSSTVVNENKCFWKRPIRFHFNYILCFSCDFARRPTFIMSQPEFCMDVTFEINACFRKIHLPGVSVS